MSDEKGKPPGVMGWWPSRAVTFIENHDTGSTQVRKPLSIYFSMLMPVLLSLKFGQNLSRLSIVGSQFLKVAIFHLIIAIPNSNVSLTSPRRCIFFLGLPRGLQICITFPFFSFSFFCCWVLKKIPNGALSTTIPIVQFHDE